MGELYGLRTRSMAYPNGKNQRKDFVDMMKEICYFKHEKSLEHPEVNEKAEEKPDE